MKSGKSYISPAVSLTPTGNRNATANGTSVDLTAYDECIVVITSDTITDGTHTPKLQDSADNSTWNDVAAGNLDGTFAAITASSVQTVGYKGTNRYVRVVVTVSGATTGGKYAAEVVRMLPKYAS
ncbi:MAG: hypothetical protein ABUS54_10255 [Actinomycetota bacterium]